jgi:hypothetical protein
MSVLEIWTGCPKNHDGLAVFARRFVLISRTSLFYHPPIRAAQPAKQPVWVLKAWLMLRLPANKITEGYSHDCL